MRVLYVQYTNPGAYPPLGRGAQLLAESGAQVCMLGTRVRATDALAVNPADAIAVRLIEEAPAGWRLKTHYGRYAAWVAREAAAWKPDWIYASDLLSAPIALGLATLTRARVLYHEHDAPSHDRPSWIIKRYLDARRRLVREADLVVAPNAERSARLSALAGGRDVLTVWNCPLRPTRRRNTFREAGELRVVFRGSINQDRLPLTMIDALAGLEIPVSLRVAGYETVGSRGYIARLVSYAAQRGVGERLRILGTVPDNDFTAICEECDLGLGLMPMETPDENMRHMTGASNKVFEYLAFGLAPLVSDLAEWRRTFVEPGFALACDPSDVQSIARALRWAADRPGEVRRIVDRGWERLCLDWNYESQFAPVRDAMWARSTGAAAARGVVAREEAGCAS